MPWYFFATLTPFLYSIVNYFDKFLVDKKIKDPLVLAMVQAMTTGIVGLAIWTVIGFPMVNLFQITLSLLSGILLALYLIPYLKALSSDDASRVIPIFQTIPVFVLIFSYLFLKETLTIKQLIGFVIILTGSISLMMKRLDGGLFKPRPALWLMFLSSAMFAVNNVIFRYVVKDLSFWSVFAFQYIGAGIGGILLYLFFIDRKYLLNDMKTIKSVVGIVGLNNIISMLALMSESYAISLVPVTFVSILSGVQPFFVLILGIILSVFFPKIIKEDITKSTIGLKIISIVMIFIGLYIVYG